MTKGSSSRARHSATREKNRNGNIINLHLLENCNYQCKHCFAHFGSGKMLPVQDWKRIVDNITAKNFVSRFNLAGGEPLLYPGLDELIDHINAKDIQTSIITNGHLLSEERICRLKGRISMVGLSIDAIQPELLRKIGRCTKTKEIFASDNCIALCKAIKETGMQLKINTVVSNLNMHEDFSGFIQAVFPDRWKILKMKRFSSGNFDNSELEITDNEFDRFCLSHASIPHIREICMKNAYIMVDSGGRLVDNTNDAYKPVANLLNEDFLAAFSKLPFDLALYESRYKPNRI